jgi:hypothetical protein
MIRVLVKGESVPDFEADDFIEYSRALYVRRRSGQQDEDDDDLFDEIAIFAPGTWIGAWQVQEERKVVVSTENGLVLVNGSVVGRVLD